MSANTATISTQLDDPEPGSTWFYSLAGIVIMVATTVAGSVLYFHAETREEDVKVVDASYLALDKARATWSEKLSSYQRYDWTLPDGKKTQKIRVPIARAMELVVQEGFTVSPVTAPAATPATGAPAKK